MCYSFLTILTELIFAMPLKAPLTMSCSSCIIHCQSRKRLLILGELIGFFLIFQSNEIMQFINACVITEFP